MTSADRPGLTAERFVEMMLDLIAAEGGSLRVNLRQISRRLGCAHTNVYNYFASYEDLRWAAFRRTLGIYGDYLVRDLNDSLESSEYLRRLISSLATFPQDHPGLYRFVASDPIDIDRVPGDILETVSGMKTWLSDVFRIAAGLAIGSDQAEKASNIVLAYIDGETLNLINGRVVPGEDLPDRIVQNALQLFEVLTTGPADQLPVAGSVRRYPSIPVLDA